MPKQELQKQQSSKDLELFHYGIPGMKWGRRRADSDGDGKVDSTPAKKSSKDSDDHTESRKLASKPLESMSNKELQTLNQRLQLETQYKALTSSPSTKQGKSQVDTILKTVNTANKVISAWNSPAAKIARKLIKSQMDKKSGNTLALTS